MGSNQVGPQHSHGWESSAELDLLSQLPSSSSFPISEPYGYCLFPRCTLSLDVYASKNFFTVILLCFVEGNIFKGFVQFTI